VRGARVALGGMIICPDDESQMKRVAFSQRGGAHLFSPAPATINTIIKPGNEKARRSGWVAGVIKKMLIVINISSPLSRHALLAQRPRGLMAPNYCHSYQNNASPLHGKIIVILSSHFN
jgi:hypothetical protein